MLSATNNPSYIIGPTVCLIRSLPLGNSSHLGHSGNGLVAKAGLSSGLSPLSFDHPQDHSGPFCPLVEHWAQGWQLSRSASVATWTGQWHGKQRDDEKSQYSHREKSACKGGNKISHEWNVFKPKMMDRSLQPVIQFPYLMYLMSPTSLKSSAEIQGDFVCNTDLFPRGRDPFGRRRTTKRDP